MDILKRIKIANLGRDPERLALKYQSIKICTINLVLW